MTEQAVRLHEALIALGTWPVTKRFVSEVSRAHEFANPSYFNVLMQQRFGHGPSEVLAMRAVWPMAKFRAWLQRQADQHGFRAHLDEAFDKMD